MAWDTASGEMMLVTSRGGGPGGETWFWKGDHWSRQVSGDIPSGVVAGLAGDPVTRTLLAVSNNWGEVGRTNASTWAWTNHGWRPITATTPPSVCGLALDPVSHELLACSEPSPAASGGPMSLWTGVRWIPLPHGDLPTGAGGYPIEADAEVTDLTAGHVLILGFSAPTSPGSPQPIRLWSWDGDAWTQRA